MMEEAEDRRKVKTRLSVMKKLAKALILYKKQYMIFETAIKMHL